MGSKGVYPGMTTRVIVFQIGREVWEVVVKEDPRGGYPAESKKKGRLFVEGVGQTTLQIGKNANVPKLREEEQAGGNCGKDGGTHCRGRRRVAHYRHRSMGRFRRHTKP